jgi:hypothetical protein
LRLPHLAMSDGGSGYSFLWRRNDGLASEQLVVDEISELPSLERFHDDFICFQKDGVHRTLHVGVAAPLTSSVSAFGWMWCSAVITAKPSLGFGM